MAVIGGYAKTCRCLVEHGANVNQKNNKGDTPLHHMINGNFEKNRGLEYLNYLNGEQRRVFRRVSEIFKYLIKYGANLNQENHADQTPIDCIILKSDLEALKYLIRHNVIDVNYMNDRGQTLLHVAAINNQIPVLDYLVRVKHVDVNIRGDHLYPWTPLHYAASSNQYESCKYLITHGANVKDLEFEDLDNDAITLIHSIQYEIGLGRSRRSAERFFSPLLQNSNPDQFVRRRIAPPKSANI